MTFVRCDFKDVKKNTHTLLGERFNWSNFYYISVLPLHFFITDLNKLRKVRNFNFVKKKSIINCVNENWISFKKLNFQPIYQKIFFS